MPKLTFNSGALRLDSKGDKTTITVHGSDRSLRAEAHSFAGQGEAAKDFTVLELDFGPWPGRGGVPADSDVQGSEKLVLYLSAEHLTQIAKAIEAVAGKPGFFNLASAAKAILKPG